MPLEQALHAIKDSEARLSSSFEADLERELGLVDRASALLLAVLQYVGPRTGKIDIEPKSKTVTGGDVQALQLLAQLYIKEEARSGRSRARNACTAVSAGRR